MKVLVHQETSSTATLLRRLREKKKVSRTELSKLTRLSVYQVEGLEGQAAHNLLSRILLYVQALGYKADDILNLVGSNAHGQTNLIKGVLGQPQFESVFQEGVKLLTYPSASDSFLGQLQLQPGKSVNRKQLPLGDLVLGIVREGVLVADTVARQTVYKKDHFFIFYGAPPVEFSNGDSHAQVSALLFSPKSSH